MMNGRQELPSHGSTDLSARNLSGDVQAGYNWRFGNWVVGWEIDLARLRARVVAE